MLKRHRFFKTRLISLIYPLIIFYLMAPVLDGFACVSCDHHALLRINQSQAQDHADCKSDNQTSESEAPGQKSHANSCTICAHSVLSVKEVVAQPPVPVVESCVSYIPSPLSIFSLSIFKPPQNSFV